MIMKRIEVKSMSNDNIPNYEPVKDDAELQQLSGYEIREYPIRR